VPAGPEVHIIFDNYGTYKTATIRNWFAKRPHFHIQFTTTYGSWSNLVERWFAGLTFKVDLFSRHSHHTLATITNPVPSCAWQKGGVALEGITTHPDNGPSP
jgi:hypothetical protein